MSVFTSQSTARAVELKISSTGSKLGKNSSVLQEVTRFEGENGGGGGGGGPAGKHACAVIMRNLNRGET